MNVVQLREGCNDGGEVETGEQPGAGQVVEAEQATHHRLGDPRHLEAVQQGGGDNPGTTWDDNTFLPCLVQVLVAITCFKEEFRVQSGKFAEQGKARSPEKVPTFLLAASLHDC